jgi:hypothetical protein
MAINPYHIVEELNGVRCSVVEKRVPEARALFLKKILEFNKLNVQMVKGDDDLYTLGVDSVIFNPVHAIYNRSLRTPEGKILNAAFWLQKEQQDEYYWNYK